MIILSKLADYGVIVATHLRARARIVRKTPHRSPQGHRRLPLATVAANC